jgi:hypothetical protein
VEETQTLKPVNIMGRSRKNKDKRREHSYYDDSYDERSRNKKFKKNRFNDNRKDKEIQQRMFVDWDSL